MSTRKTTAERIEAAKLEKQQAEARIKKLLQEQKADERKRRNHRIIKRGANLESLLPDTIMLSDARFHAFLTKTVANDFGRKILAEFVTAQEKEDAANAASAAADGATPAPMPEAAAQKPTVPAPLKPAQMQSAQGATDAGRTVDGARQAG